MASSHNATRHPVTVKIKGAPDYDDAAFWDKKFVTGQDVGEWLNPGDALLDAAISHLEQSQVISGGSQRIKPRLLHLGPGISALGSKLCDAFVQRGWRGDGIVNVDFSSEAVRLGRKLEEQKDEPANVMHWVQADLCSWDQVSSSVSLPFAPVGVVVDKSTSDAIATSASRTFHSSPGRDAIDSTLPAVSPVVQEILYQTQEEQLTLAPVELLALHLASITQKGALWLSLSYSNTRFDGFAHLPAYWEIVKRTPLKAPSGQTASASAMVPEVFHWVYVLQRK
ncbi:hypothetical protein PISL3812_09139 [Talaromyces islandicus]|uniref:Uncharacterized protein n=1 Tax=Talaromyces islandicus TaxID=28573 RepID=A0A0U1M8V3_TALIS|nr:hypothetical protein PISL3812_09139 [Talaromyces islandicus]